MISIVIPIFNGADYIKETYKMICDSSEKDLEVIFVNDGSKDDSGNIINEIAMRDNRVKYYEKENGGIAAARNYGLDQVSGEFVCFLDQDDYIKSDMFTVLKEDLIQTGADYVKAHASAVKDGIEQSYCEIRKQICLINGTVDYQHFLQTLIMRDVSSYPECNISPSIWSCMFRTDFLRKKEMSFWAFCDYEDDWLFNIKAFINADKICLETRTVYGWRINQLSESHNRIFKDKYIHDFYKRHNQLQEFLWESLKEAQLTEKETLRFKREMQKQVLLWGLSNETGRGIKQNTVRESTRIMKNIVAQERKKGICKGINRHALSTSTSGGTGVKWLFYIFRDKLLTFLLLHHLEGLAVRVNKKYLHGRWHN